MVEDNRTGLTLKFLILSLFGIIAFFIPITVKGQSTIPIEALITWLITTFPKAAKIYAFTVILIGAIRPFIKKTWNKNSLSVIFTITKLIGAFFTIWLFSGFAPEAVSRPDHGPFLFNSLAVQVGTLIPVGAIFITFLMDYGFIDFIGQFLKPIMRAVWKTPGKTAVVAVASFMGSTAVGVMMTNELYKQRKYTIKEAVSVASGFSTVAISFLIVIAKTANILPLWSEFFFVSLFVTFAISAIVVRIPPLAKMPDSYYKNMEGIPEENIKGNLLTGAWNEGINICRNAGPVLNVTFKNIRDSFDLVFEVLPNFMSIGLIALIVANYTSVFDFFGYIFYPLTLVLGIPEPLLAAKAAFLGLAEMFLPVMVIVNAPEVTRFIICVMSVSQILMFSTTIPTILSTEIPVSLKELVIIWFERTIVCFLITVPIAYFLIR